MPNYEVDFSYNVREGDSIILNDIESVEEAEFQGLQYARDTYPDVTGITVDMIKTIP